MMTKNQKPYAIVYHYDDSDWNDNTGWISVFYTKEELDEFTNACDEEQVYTGKCYFIYTNK